LKSGEGSFLRILFVTNEQDHSDLVARFASRFELTSEDLILLARISDDSLMELKKPAARKKKKKAAVRAKKSKLPPPAHTVREITLNDGNADTAISLASEEHNVDLVVLGMCGVAINSLITHNIIRSVVSHTRRPVFVIRSDLCKQVNSIKVLFATDGSLSADATGRFLSSIPFRLKTEVAVLNVISSEEEAVAEPSPDNGSIKQPMDPLSAQEQFESMEIIRRSLDLFGDRFTRKQGISRYGDPTVVTLQEADKIKPDIIAVGYRGSVMIDRIPGTMPRNLLRYSHSCLLIGKLPQ